MGLGNVEFSGIIWRGELFGLGRDIIGMIWDWEIIINSQEIFGARK